MKLNEIVNEIFQIHMLDLQPQGARRQIKQAEKMVKFYGGGIDAIEKEQAELQKQLDAKGCHDPEIEKKLAQSMKQWHELMIKIGRAEDSKYY